jgi:hypothetical protein
MVNRKDSLLLIRFSSCVKENTEDNKRSKFEYFYFL